VAASNTANAPSATFWSTVSGVDGFAELCWKAPHMELLSDPETFCLTHRTGEFGPVMIVEFLVGADAEVYCGSLSNGYRVAALRSGRVESTHRGSSVVAVPGTAVLYQPEDDAGSTWSAGSRLLGVKIDRSAVEDALSDSLGYQLTSPIDFSSSMSIRSAAARSWLTMASMFADQLFRAGSVLSQPMVGLPFVDSLIHGLLLAADNPHRVNVAKDSHQISPRAVRAAVQIVEEEAHLPLTVSAIAARCHVSVRSLQQDFRRHMGLSPMAYLREVRLRRAHRSLLESDPSTTTVAAIAYQWGFTNLGRFAAVHTARYDELPAATLRRNLLRRNTTSLKCTVKDPESVAQQRMR
jgi:AraC-like DNA-binding protein